jgi:hypothetical protein
MIFIHLYFVVNVDNPNQMVLNFLDLFQNISVITIKLFIYLYIIVKLLIYKIIINYL